MDVSTLIAILRRWWVTLLVGTWVAALVGYALASQIQPVYESRARVLVGPINADVDTLRASSFLVLTYGELVESDQVLQQTIATLGLDMSVDDLRDEVTTAANDQTRFLTIRARSADPAEAAAVTQALVDQLVALSTRETRRPEGALQVVNAAAVDEVAVSPQVPIVVGLAALAGLLGALLLVALVELTTGAIRTRAELGSTVGLDTLGEVARPRGARFRRGGATPAPLTVGADYGEAAARLMIAGDQPPRVVVVVGTTVEDASDVAAAKLAVALAGVGHAVTLVDANDVVPTVTRLFEREVASRGSGDVTTPWSPIDTIVRINDHLQLVPAGVAPVDPTFQVDRFVQALLERASVVVVATAPLAESVRAVQWLRVADVVVLGVRRYRTRRDAASEAAETLALGTDGPLVTLLHEEEPVTRSPRAAPSPGEGEPRRDVRAPQAVERIRRRRPSSAPRDSG